MLLPFQKIEMTDTTIFNTIKFANLFASPVDTWQNFSYTKVYLTKPKQKAHLIFFLFWMFLCIQKNENNSLTNLRDTAHQTILKFD